jgi:hypothetical protein
MSIEKEEVKRLIVEQLSELYDVRTNYFVKGRTRDTILPICIMSEADQPCLVIRIRLREDKDSQKYSGKPIKRLKRWEEISGNQVITIWCRSQAEDITRIVEEAFNS